MELKIWRQKAVGGVVWAAVLRVAKVSEGLLKMVKAVGEPHLR